MDLFDNLAAYGLTVAVLQIAILLGIVVFIVGFYWRYIVAGVGILFCVLVFSGPGVSAKAKQETTKPNETSLEKPAEQKQELPKVEIKPEPPVAEVKPQTEKDMFMEDCVKYGGYTDTQCSALWRDRENDVQSIKWRNQWKKNYFMKVNYVRT